VLLPMRNVYQSRIKTTLTIIWINNQKVVIVLVIQKIIWIWMYTIVQFESSPVVYHLVVDLLWTSVCGNIVILVVWCCPRERERERERQRDDWAWFKLNNGVHPYSYNLLFPTITELNNSSIPLDKHDNNIY
jgi:hypothetical protein